jgi:hypothetical protein
MNEAEEQLCDDKMRPSNSRDGSNLFEEGNENNRDSTGEDRFTLSNFCLLFVSRESMEVDH